MARIVLTTDQKEGLLISPEFKKQVKWALLRIFTYWKGLDGAGMDATLAKKWFQARDFIARNNTITLAEDYTHVKIFAEDLIKNIQCVNSPGTYDEAETISYLNGNNNVGQGGTSLNFFDQMADAWLTQQTAAVPF